MRLIYRFMLTFLCGISLFIGQASASENQTFPMSADTSFSIDMALANKSCAHSRVLAALSGAQRDQFAGFLDEVLRSMSSKDFFSMIDAIIKTKEPQSDKDLYDALLQEVVRRRSRFDFYARLKALWHQKKILGAQLNALLKERASINGIVEIGSPATYASTIQIPMEGDVTVINDVSQSWVMNRINTGRVVYSLQTHFLPLNEYEPISQTVADESVDVVICFIGLHHCPEDKLDDFIRSIVRILRPGGSLILREHDAHSEEVLNRACAAHAVFNAIVANESLENELKEIRNFRSLDYWIELLEKHGFKQGTEKLFQDNDPTRNALMKFTKLGKTDQEKVAQLKNEHSKDYERAVIVPQDAEWVNVDFAKEYAKFLDHTPWYQFPFYDSVKTYWSVFGQSWNSARRKNSLWKVLTSDATQTNFMVGAFTTLEFLAKSVCAFPIRLLAGGTAALRVKAIVHDPNNATAQFDAIKVINEHGALKMIELPRYVQFLDLIKELLKNDIAFKNIAGQEKVYCKVRYVKADHNANPCLEIEGCESQYQWTLPTQPQYIFCTLLVEIATLKEVFKTLAERNVEIMYVHDSRDN